MPSLQTDGQLTKLGRLVENLGHDEFLLIKLLIIILPQSMDLNVIFSSLSLGNGDYLEQTTLKE